MAVWTRCHSRCVHLACTLRGREQGLPWRPGVGCTRVPPPEARCVHQARLVGCWVCSCSFAHSLGKYRQSAPLRQGWGPPAEAHGYGPSSRSFWTSTQTNPAGAEAAAGVGAVEGLEMLNWGPQTLAGSLLPANAPKSRQPRLRVLAHPGVLTEDGAPELVSLAGARECLPGRPLWLFQSEPPNRSHTCAGHVVFSFARSKPKCSVK